MTRNFYIAIAVLMSRLSIFTRIVLALRCKHCESDVSWEACIKSSEVTTCSVDKSVEKAVKFHHYSGVANISSSPSCFRLQLTTQSTGKDTYRSGCSYDRSFCQEWDKTKVIVVQCSFYSEESQPSPPKSSGSNKKNKPVEAIEKLTAEDTNSLPLDTNKNSSATQEATISSTNGRNGSFIMPVAFVLLVIVIGFGY
ncbi:uncharacterized protein LOC131681902 [Topomyia yanbarensis]|uniref:uncharacterized protein LOC131681902 n=1 Tax=Topomyia yanbarensis TaxID=2498891 RepID=UPI00273BDD57|nr:uncharacterized protein LOC131681902 [Topomyia yanbarensis]